MLARIRALCNQGGRMALLLALAASWQVRAAQVSTGVEDILWPAIIVVAPFVMVHDILFGSDSRSMESAEREARKLLDAHPAPLPTLGIYTGPLNLRWALYGLLVERQLPFVEVDVAGSKWLLELAKDPQPLILKAQDHKFIRLQLGQRGDPDCFVWKGYSEDFTDNPPVRPGTCMVARFTDELTSNLHLQVDAARVSRREMKLILADRASGQTLLAVPFWQSQFKGQPLLVTLSYRTANESGTFVSLSRKLAPVEPTMRNVAPPYVLKHEFESAPSSENELYYATRVAGVFRPLQMDWDSNPAPPRNESWSQGYARAYDSGKPVIVNGSLLIDPQRDAAHVLFCAFPRGRGCDFANSFATSEGVLSVRGEAAYHNPHTTKYVGVALRGEGLSVDLGLRRYTGEAVSHVQIFPESLPEPVQICNDWSLACVFWVKIATVANGEVVMRGKFHSHSGTSIALPPDEYELVVPLDKLPQSLKRNVAQ